MSDSPREAYRKSSKGFEELALADIRGRGVDFRIVPLAKTHARPIERPIVTLRLGASESCRLQAASPS